MKRLTLALATMLVLMLTTVATATFPRTSCCASVVRLIPEILQKSAVLAFGAMPCSQRWNALAGRVIDGSLQNGYLT